MTIEELERVVGSALRGARVRPSVVTLRPAAMSVAIEFDAAVDRGEAARALRQTGLRVEEVAWVGLVARPGR